MGKFGVLRQNDAKRLGAKIGRHVPGGGIVVIKVEAAGYRQRLKMKTR
jgi:hypothetical protein